MIEAKPPVVYDSVELAFSRRGRHTVRNALLTSNETAVHTAKRWGCRFANRQPIQILEES